MKKYSSKQGSNLIKTANGYKIKLSKQEWTRLGKEAGWIKESKDSPCWEGYKMIGTKRKKGEEVPNCVPEKELDSIKKAVKNEGLKVEAAEYQGKKVKLNKPMRGDVKKYKVYVKNDKGNVVKVNFGDKKMEIKRDNPKARKNFRARHNCKNPGPKWKARYWSCKMWSDKPVSEILKD